MQAVTEIEFGTAQTPPNHGGSLPAPRIAIRSPDCGSPERPTLHSPLALCLSRPGRGEGRPSCMTRGEPWSKLPSPGVPYSALPSRWCSSPSRRAARTMPRCEGRVQNGGRLADLRPEPGGNALQPAHRHQHRQRAAGSAPAWSVRRRRPAAAGRKRRRSSANGTIYGITNWSVVFAVDARTGKEKWRWDPRGQSDRGAPGDLLRRRQSRPRALSGDGHRADHRRPAAGARRRDRQGRCGNRASPIRRTTTRSRWRRASPRAR